MNAESNGRRARKGFTANRRIFIAAMVAIVIVSLVVIAYSVQLVLATVSQGSAAQTTLPSEFLSQYGMGLLSAAIAVGGSCLGAGIAIYGAASAGAAAIAERPESSIWVLILAGLGEGVAIYGLLIAIIILSKLPAVA